MYFASRGVVPIYPYSTVVRKLWCSLFVFAITRASFQSGTLWEVHGRVKRHKEGRFLVVGANGAQGRIVARDLALKGHDVVLAGLDTCGVEALRGLSNVTSVHLDLIDAKNTRECICSHTPDVVVNCAIDDFNLDVTSAALAAGAHYVDLGSEEHITRAQFALHSEFKGIGRTAITGMGSTPGITNVLLRHVKPEFDTITTVHLGFAWDCNQATFVSPFSMDAIAWEFTNPARILEDGRFVNRNPKECTLHYSYINIPKRRTYYTPHIEHFTFYEYLKDMGIKNIAVCSSFPQHSHEVIETLISLGFLSKTPRNFHGQAVTPCEFTTDILRDIPVPEGYREWEDLWIYIEGTRHGRSYQTRLDCYVETQPGWESAGCNIDTAWPVSLTAEMLVSGEISEKGVYAPEGVMPSDLFLHRLEERSFQFFRDGEPMIFADSESELVERAHCR